MADEKKPRDVLTAREGEAVRTMLGGARWLVDVVLTVDGRVWIERPPTTLAAEVSRALLELGLAVEWDAVRQTRGFVVRAFDVDDLVVCTVREQKGWTRGCFAAFQNVRGRVEEVKPGYEYPTQLGGRVPVVGYRVSFEEAVPVDGRPCYGFWFSAADLTRSTS